ncbi:hypothetical protein [Nannocystis radixulma]|uniref:Tryptophan synthase alpha chain n=1 Tax=Nannocystis radixulma TaxID=2995305 RepID=A0ABT5B897_9BACT|nr:hypothetical protein [Nannocystis radixulma]MDC0669749.1 hypothetical protein [Nannocystis radixulma]
MIFAALASGCGPVSSESSTTTSSTTTSTTTTSSTTELAPTSTSTTSAPTASDSSDFVIKPDLPTPGAACDAWQDTCPEGQKCKPFADILGPWASASCVPVADVPRPTGETCTTPEFSIIDECERGAVCHGLGTAEGLRCHALCTGSPTERSCADECSWCFTNGDVAGVCLFPCDPRAHDCPQGQSCQILAEAPRFICGVGAGTSAAGESCAAAACSEGTACVDAALVPGCADAKCCAPVCDLESPDTCAAALPGTTCAAWPVSGPEFQDACRPAGLGLCTAV